MSDAALKERLRVLRQGLQPETSTPEPRSATKSATPPTSNTASSTDPQSAEANEDQDLFERLRNLKSTNASPPQATSPRTQISVRQRDEQDEVEAFIRSTQDQLNLERSNSEN